MALTIRYVSVSGGGAHDGTSEADAWTWAEMKANYSNGQHIYVKAGTYSFTSSEAFTLIAGTTTPVIFEGYSSTPGDGWTSGSAHNADLSIDDTNFPVLDFAGSGIGIDINTNAQYHVFVNFKIQSDNIGNADLVDMTAENIALVHCIIELSGTGGAAATCIDCSNNFKAVADCDILQRSTTSGAEGILHSGNYLSVTDCRVYCDEGRGVDISGAFYWVYGNILCGDTEALYMGGTSSGRSTVIGNTLVTPDSTGICIENSNNDADDMQPVVNNLLTDGDYAVYNGYQATSVLPRLFLFNRYDRQTSGDVNGYGDFQTGRVKLQ